MRSGKVRGVDVLALTSWVEDVGNRAAERAGEALAAGQEDRAQAWAEVGFRAREMADELVRTVGQACGFDADLTRRLEERGYTVRRDEEGGWFTRKEN